MKNDALPKRLKELRKSYDYKQEFVASYLNIGRQAYSHYETGRNTPSTDTLCKLAILYHVSIESLLNLLSPSGTTVYPSYSKATSNDLVAEDAALSNFFDYLSDPSNQKKLKFHTRKEKELLYYFEQISTKDQDEFLEFLKIKAKNTSKT